MTVINEYVTRDCFVKHHELTQITNDHYVAMASLNLTQIGHRT